MKQALRLTVLVALSAPAFAGDTIHVGPSHPITTVQGGIDAADDGDTVLVEASHTYNEDILFSDKLITVKAEDGPGPAVLQGTGTGPVVRFETAGLAGQVLEGFVIRDGLAETGGGIRISDCSPVIRLCTIRENEAVLGAGASVVQGAQPVFELCAFLLNDSKPGPVTGVGTITGAGGGLWAEGSVVTLTQCLFEANTTEGDGGGLHLQGLAAGPSTVTACSFLANRSQNGGGISLAGSSEAAFKRVRIRENQAGRFEVGGTSAPRGGGVYSVDSDPQFETCEIVENRAFLLGVFQETSLGGGVYIESRDQFHGSYAAPSFRSCTIAANEAGTLGLLGQGGGIYLEDTLATVENSILWSNDAWPGNPPQPAGPQLALFSTILTVRYSDVEGGSAAMLSDLTSSITYGPANLDVDPLFEGQIPPSLAFFYGIQASSPMIDAGDPATTFPATEIDIDGDVRLSGAAVDLGSDEFADCNDNDVEDHVDVGPTGASDDCNLNLVPDECESLVTNYGPASPNSVGDGADMGWSGSLSVAANSFTVSVSECPPNSVGIFIYGTDQGQIPHGDGWVLVSPVFRIEIPVVTDGAGNASLTLDFTQNPMGAGAGQIVSGEDFNFQFWYRDDGFGTGVNLSDGLNVWFCP